CAVSRRRAPACPRSARRGPARPRCGDRGPPAARAGRQAGARRRDTAHPLGVSEPLNVDEFEAAARERLEPGPYAYYAGGAGDEHTLRANSAAFTRWELRPRVLVDVSDVSTETTVLGTHVELPLLVAPTAFHRLAHPEGELATARAAAA